MAAALRATPFSEPLADRLAASRGRDGVRLFWLGQAGFVIDARPHRIVVDPYLSDTLAVKYAGTAYPHARMMPAPVSAGALGEVDLVLITHQHTDHMDPGTLAPLAARLPHLRFVVPAASLDQARARIGVGAERLILLDAGEVAEPLPGLAVRALRAAHETLERDEAGRHRFLGYGLEAAGRRIFHSGDTVPFDGQRQEVAALAPDLALLPVNGRSDALRAAGFAGNFTLEEAIALGTACAIPAMIAHHHGLFAFNTADPAAIDAAAAAHPGLLRARTQVEYALRID